MKVLRMLDPI